MEQELREKAMNFAIQMAVCGQFDYDDDAEFIDTADKFYKYLSKGEIPTSQ